MVQTATYVPAGRFTLSVRVFPAARVWLLNRFPPPSVDTTVKLCATWPVDVLRNVNFTFPFSDLLGDPAEPEVRGDPPIRTVTDFGAD